MVIVAIGEIVVDWVSTRQNAGPIDADSFWRCLGGNAANVAIGVSRLGGSARLVGKLGSDIHTKYLQHALAAEKVDVDHILIDPRYGTAQCYCFWDRGDDYSFYNWPHPHAAEMLAPEDLQPAILHDALFLHATGISLMSEPRRASVLKAIEMAKERNVLVSFDVTFPTGRDLELSEWGKKAMSQADVLKLNFHELSIWSQLLGSDQLLGCDATDEKQLAAILSAGRRVYKVFAPALMAITLGEHGSLLITEETHALRPALKVKCIAAVGAGDGYIAGMLQALSEHLPVSPNRAALAEMDEAALTQVASFANAVGALVTRAPGASDGLPRRQEVEELLSASSSVAT